MPIRAFYHAPVSEFLRQDDDRLLGLLATENPFSLEEQQRGAWQQEFEILKSALGSHPDGRIFLEFYIPRMGKRVDAILITQNIVFVLEFKVGATEYGAAAIEQVVDYALDLKNFHEGSHAVPVVPVLIATHAPDAREQTINFGEDLVALPLSTNTDGLAALIQRVCSTRTFTALDIEYWMSRGYRPTPTIIQAAEVLYRTHTVAEISRSEAEDQNLHETTACVNDVIDRSRSESRKSICFVTGVPGSGKTLAGLNFATRRSEMHPDEHAVFLSGNGPLVAVLREALARDKNKRGQVSKKQSTREVSSFVQNIHHFRDEYIKNPEVPVEKVVVFDEAQRAWTREKAASFMKQKKGLLDFAMSEPEFLISVMDRHPDWCTVVCLIGGGQEINTGEAGIAEWLAALEAHFPTWEIYVSPRIELPEYVSSIRAHEVLASTRVHADGRLHLAVCMRSYRAETLSTLMTLILDNAHEEASSTFSALSKAYPLFLTRDLTAARNWLRAKARGSERFGLVASSGAQRLRREGICIKAKIDPANWFLNDRTDVRSSFYLEEVATEFDVQGLELDWVAVCWDGDLRHDGKTWINRAFKGTRWQAVSDESKKLYLKNTYRVLLTRARQGMVLFIPNGDPADPTAPPEIYDGTFEFLQRCGIPLLETACAKTLVI